MSDSVNHPEHYPANSIEWIEKVVDGLDGKDAYLLGNVLKYVIRAGKKNDDDLDKANNYAHRLCTGMWRWEQKKEKESYPYVFPDASNLVHDYIEQLDKIRSEVYEVIQEAGYCLLSSNRFENMIIEVMDVIHACETFLRYFEDNADMSELRKKVIEKNQKRGYYG